MKSLSIKIVYLIVSATIIYFWIIPNYLEYTKNKDLYFKKLDSLEKLDTREIPSDIKKFHAELFKEDISKYFNNTNRVDISTKSIPNNKYEIKATFSKIYLQNFLKALRDIPLNYRVYINDGITYNQSNKIIEATFIVTPY